MILDIIKTTFDVVTIIIVIIGLITAIITWFNLRRWERKKNIIKDFKLDIGRDRVARQPEAARFP